MSITFKSRHPQTTALPHHPTPKHNFTFRPTQPIPQNNTPAQAHSQAVQPQEDSREIGKDKKRRNLRYLKTEEERQTNTNTSQQTNNKPNLSKSKNSSTESLRIHKIKSIAVLQAKKQAKVGPKPPRPSKAYRYQTDHSPQQLVKSKDNIMKAISKHRMVVESTKSSKAIRQKSEGEEFVILRQEFRKLADKMIEIQLDSPNDEKKMNAQMALTALINKNLKASANILHRTCAKLVKKRQKEAWRLL